MLLLLASGALLYTSSNWKSRTELQIHTRRFKAFKIQGISLSCKEFFPLRGKTSPKARSDEGNLCTNKPKATVQTAKIGAVLCQPALPHIVQALQKQMTALLAP